MLGSISFLARQARDAGRSIEDALAGFRFVWMLTCLLDGAFLVMGQSAYVFGPIKHTSALTAWPAPIDVSLYLIVQASATCRTTRFPHIADERTRSAWPALTDIR